MLPERSPKKPEPKPTGPGPEAVRKALAKVRETFDAHDAGDINDSEAFGRLYSPVYELECAARAWLAQQDGEASE